MSEEQTDQPDERGIPGYARGYDRHPGRIGRTTRDSERAWPTERRARDGAPNVVLVLLDDMGYSDIGPFGSEIPTPNLDRLAENGHRLTNYHTTPVCSPARAAMMTGLNPHRAGFGSVANSDPGFPGMRLELDEDVLTLPEILREHGYATYAIGKWHLTRDALMNDAAARHSWPVQRGFDRYYGTTEGCNSFFHPNRLVVDNSPLTIEEFPEDYYLTDDLTDKAVEMVKALRASDSRKPFFLYFAHHAMHGPLGAKPADLAKHRGRYAEGWDEIRRGRHARQIAQGIFPEDLPLPPRDGGKRAFAVPAWEDLSAEQQDIFARYMEVYAAMVDNVDQSLGRILDTVEELGELDNTIVIFTSDNGGTMEGGPEGTRSYFSRFVHLDGVPADWEADVARDPDLIGGARTMVHYPRGWAMASNTPFRFYKGQTFAGGVRVPFLISWPDGLPRSEGDDGIRRQYQYVTDVVPTILELVGATPMPQRHGLPAQSMDGVSFRSVLDDPGSASTRYEQYAEFGGNRGFYRDGWKVVTAHRPGAPYDDSEWELYHVESDPNELVDLAAAEPGKLKELAEAWERAAWANTVFPLNGHGRLENSIRRPAEDEFTAPVRLLPGTPTLERYRSHQLIMLRDVDIDVELEHGADDRGVLVAHGDQGGGYLVYLEDGVLHAGYNEYGRLHVLAAAEPLAPGTHRVRLSLRTLPDFRWCVEVGVDGEPVAALPSVAMLVGMAPFSGIDVGLTRGGPVHWDLFQRHGSFPYTGVLRSVTYLPGRQADYDPALVMEAERNTAAAFD
ncbi:arylsulfatase [Nocardioides insulae]|uniref:arylsulfatase n=1 Tax=Nocardioides insulae TaxID=394734 RepID=UPI00041E529D|nr:arylsulfatase [Nocardioides insulae]